MADKAKTQTKQAEPEVTALRPQPGPQTLALSSPADILIYGGAAGGGKTWTLLVEPLRHMEIKGFGAVIFRRTYPQVTNEGGLWDESEEIYPHIGARPRSGALDWTLPTYGNRIKFAHMQHEDSKFDWKGAQIPLLAFDQLEDFSESQFFYMLSRNRSTCGVRPYVRATVNPDAESWVARFVEWWIDQDTGFPIKERGGKTRWFIRTDEGFVWGNSRQELRERYPAMFPKSVSFIPASIYDNKILLKRDPGYLANLMALPLVERERLLRGNWKIKPAAGKVFNRGWFEIVNAIPQGGIVVRFWDFAGTAKKKEGDDPDFTASVLMLYVNTTWYVLDCYAAQIGPAEQDRVFMNLARQDFELAKNREALYSVAWEIEPGSAGLRENSRLIKLLADPTTAGSEDLRRLAKDWTPIPGRGRRPEGDKLTRSKALAVQAEAGHVKLLAGRWNEDWLTHMHHQPDWNHDDIHDASAGAFNETLMTTGRKKAGSHQG